MKNIKTKILVSLIAFSVLTTAAGAATVPGVALVVAPSSLNETVGNTFDTAIVVKTPGNKVYAVEGTIAFDGLSCQNVTIADGLMAQSVPTCAKPYFLVGIPSGTATDMAILRVSVKAVRAGDATLALSAVDVIGEGVSLSDVATGAKYSIAENVTSNPAPKISHPKAQPKSEEVAVVSKQASSTPVTQLAAVAEFVAINSVMFWILGFLAVVLGFRYVMSKRAISAVPQSNTPPTRKGK